ERAGANRTPPIEVPPFYSPRLLGLTTNATLIRDAGGVPTVQWQGAADRVPRQSHGIRFVSSGDVEQLHAASAHRRVAARGHRLRAEAEDPLGEQGGARPGVLYSLCRAIGASLDRTRPNAMVAAVAIQALKRTGSAGDDTLAHLRQIFSAARNERDGIYVE